MSADYWTKYCDSCHLYYSSPDIAI